MLAENTYDKHRKYRKNNKCNKIPDLEKKGSQEGPRNVPKYRKNCKSNKDFSCYVKRLSNKYGKNSKNNKFNEILHLEREKVKKGFEMSANFATFLSSNFVMLSSFAKMKSSVTNVTLFIITDSSKIL